METKMGRKISERDVAEQLYQKIEKMFLFYEEFRDKPYAAYQYARGYVEACYDAGLISWHFIEGLRKYIDTNFIVLSKTLDSSEKENQDG
jgi:hypothetical protein